LGAIKTEDGEEAGRIRDGCGIKTIKNLKSEETIGEVVDNWRGWVALKWFHNF
jgi:hypothetical protein